MKSQLLKKILAVCVCLLLFVTVFAGCKGTTADTYKWKTRIEEEKVWVEYEKDDTSSEGDDEDSDDEVAMMKRKIENEKEIGYNQRPTHI